MLAQLFLWNKIMYSTVYLFKVRKHLCTYTVVILYNKGMHWSISVPGYDMLVWYGMTGCDAAYTQHTKNIKTSTLRLIKCRWCILIVYIVESARISASMNPYSGVLPSHGLHKKNLMLLVTSLPRDCSDALFLKKEVKKSLRTF